MTDEFLYWCPEHRELRVRDGWVIVAESWPTNSSARALVWDVRAEHADGSRIPRGHNWHPDPLPEMERLRDVIGPSSYGDHELAGAARAQVRAQLTEDPFEVMAIVAEGLLHNASDERQRRAARMLQALLAERPLLRAVAAAARGGDAGELSAALANDQSAGGELQLVHLLVAGQAACGTPEQVGHTGTLEFDAVNCGSCKAVVAFMARVVLP